MDTLKEKHYINSAEEFFDFYGTDREGGLHKHMFVARSSAIIPSLDGEEVKDRDSTLCVICNEPEKKHMTFHTCQVCYETYDSSQFFWLSQCGHEYCLYCVRMHL